MKAANSKPEIVTRNGKPVSVILPIKKYQEMLERLEDAEDVAWLKRARRKKLQFRPLVRPKKWGRVSTLYIGTLPRCERSTVLTKIAFDALALTLLAVSVSKFTNAFANLKNGMSIMPPCGKSTVGYTTDALTEA
jgi:prevent-host-death family protein